MDFCLLLDSRKQNEGHRDTIILSCASRQYFAEGRKASGAYPLLWTNGLMAPEAYRLKSALDGWINRESDEQVRERAAGAYDKYQRCGLPAGQRLFATGW